MVTTGDFFYLSDNDLITIFDSSDLNFAIQCSRILKITLFGKYLSSFLQSNRSCKVVRVTLTFSVMYKLTYREGFVIITKLYLLSLFFQDVFYRTLL